VSTLEELERVAARAAALAASRDKLICDLRAEGVSLRRIAAAAGVSHQTVKNLADRGH
jgi:lambda repressor-like predicted transcriptional regulator